MSFPPAPPPPPVLRRRAVGALPWAPYAAADRLSHVLSIIARRNVFISHVDSAIRVLQKRLEEVGACGCCACGSVEASDVYRVLGPGYWERARGGCRIKRSWSWLPGRIGRLQHGVHVLYLWLM